MEPFWERLHQTPQFEGSIDYMYVYFGPQSRPANFMPKYSVLSGVRDSIDTTAADPARLTQYVTNGL